MSAPTPGRIVLYWIAPGEALPAVVLRVRSAELVDLEVFGAPIHERLQSASQGTGVRQWDWPPRD